MSTDPGISMHPHRQRPRADSNVSVETLPPEPVQSNPMSLRPSHAAREPSDHIPAKFYAPSLLSLIQITHRYSSYVASGFLGLHALNTCVIPLITAISSQDDALSKIDNGFMITRYLYRPSESVEIGLILAPLAVHVITGMILRIRRIYLERNLYGEGILAWHARQTRINRAKGISWPRIRALPTLGYSSTAATGWATLSLVSLHAWTTRYLPWNYGGDGETSITIVSHALQKHPILTYTLYAGLIAVGTFHIISGWGRWLKLTFTPRGRRIKNYLVMGTVTAWLFALARVGRLQIFSRGVKVEYDTLYQRLWGAF
jgi:Flp pilus assembly pilin Flp